MFASVALAVLLLQLAGCGGGHGGRLNGRLLASAVEIAVAVGCHPIPAYLSVPGIYGGENNGRSGSRLTRQAATPSDARGAGELIPRRRRRRLRSPAQPGNTSSSSRQRWAKLNCNIVEYIRFMNFHFADS